MPGHVLQAPVRVCFVCSGNICRSPTAEVVLREQAGAHPGLVEVSSAGTGGWHVGEEMDRRSRRTMLDAGHAVARHSAQQFDAADFDRLDVVVALDAGHRQALEALAGLTADVPASRAKIVMLRDFDPELAPGEEPDVADPYYGGASGFTDVLAQIERSCAELLTAIEHAVANGRRLVPAGPQ
jgi:protein-tyrosine phosphatase